MEAILNLGQLVTVGQLATCSTIENFNDESFQTSRHSP